MIRSAVKKAVTDFFLHIEINSLNRPYTSLPRPYSHNPVSNLLKRVFEKNWIRRVFGLNLATAMLLVPLGSGLQTEATIPSEPPVVLVRQDLVSTYIPAETSIHTQPREYVRPVAFTHIGQDFRAGHPAYDLNAPLGSSVYAFTAGQVYFMEDGLFGYGRHIILDHGHGLFSLYAHLQSFNVESGQVVQAGDKIGEVGMTGYTTGPHLHFEVHDSGLPVNPGSYLSL